MRRRVGWSGWRVVGHLEWRTAALALLAALAATSSALVLALDLATGGGLAVVRGVLVATCLAGVVVAGYLVLRRNVTGVEAGAVLHLGAVATAVSGVVQPDLGWQWLSASVLSAVPVLGVMHLRRWGLVSLTAVACLGAPLVFAAWEPWSLLTLIASVAMAAVPAVVVGVVWALAQRLDAARADAARAAGLDELTGLLNRHGLAVRIGPLVRAAARAGEHVSVVVADVDHFKRVNDTFGHLTGDRVLVAVAEALRSAVREDDLLVRWGGEEVALVTRGEAGRVVRVAERLRAAVEDVDVAGLPRTTASLGTASTPAPHGATGSSAAELTAQLLDRADAALYEAKRSGRNRVCHAGPLDVAAEGALTVVLPADLSGTRAAPGQRGRDGRTPSSTGASRGTAAAGG